jgi:hypothetical protein
MDTTPFLVVRDLTELHEGEKTKEPYTHATHLVIAANVHVSDETTPTRRRMR